MVLIKKNNVETKCLLSYFKGQSSSKSCATVTVILFKRSIKGVIITRALVDLIRRFY